MPSFIEINYSLRPAKNVERKVMVECLRGLQRRFDLASYRYVGMGSMWFVDFILFHKAFALRDMISIENEKEYVPRARYNAPFGCIRVEEGESSQVLKDLNLAQGPRSLVWLDYDKDLTSAPIFEDMRILSEALPSGSVVMITLNAHAHQLHETLPGGSVTPRTQVLAKRLNLSEAEIPTEATTKVGFAPFLAQALFDRLDSLVGRNSGGLRRLYPILNFWYKDNAPMITIGGMIANADDAELLAECELPHHSEFARGRDQVVISIPNLTQREKFALDRVLPCDVAPTPDEVEADFPLSVAEITGYHQFYRFYPLFAEMVS